MSGRIALAVALVVAGTVAATGCGDGSDSPASGSATSGAASIPGPKSATTADPSEDGRASRRRFVELADEVCASHEQALADAFTGLQGAGSSLSAFVGSVDDAVAVVADLASELDAVPLPDSRQAAAYVANVDNTAVVLARARDAARAGDAPGVQESVEEIAAIGETTRPLVRQLAFEECGRAGV